MSEAGLLVVRSGALQQHRWIEHYAVEHPENPRWNPGAEPPICHADPEHGAMRLHSGIATKWWECSRRRDCGAIRRLCDIATHGEILHVSDALNDFLCAECRDAHAAAHSMRSTPGRRRVAVEAAHRGGTCEFTFGDTRCASRFEYGRLQWHHRDPTEKIAAIATLATGSSLAVLVAELEKCDLLCRFHHRLTERRGG